MEHVKLDCTALIKTFNRPPVLFHLLKSIRNCYPDLPIIVVDDSTDDKKIINKNHCTEFNAHWLELPFDTGLSEGRNAGLSLVKTKFTHIFDDDNLLKDNTRLQKMQYILENTDIDLIGTVTQNDKICSTFAHKFINVETKEDKDYTKYVLTCSRDLKEEDKLESPLKELNLYKCQIVHNNFMAYTEKLKQCPWRPYLKLQEHELFFVDWYFKNFTVATCPNLILNATIYIKKDYRVFRKRKFLREKELTMVYCD
tara:strand:+ start:269 stop:1033 length:765 start_codon:yes stop_codon:yes gene_type:complete